MHFWSLRTITSPTTSVTVHLALACHFLLLFGGVVALGEARRVEGLWVEYSHLKVKNGWRPCV